jgi:hypothetical protein
VSQNHELRCYDYVNQPYPAVREVLRADARGLFARATSAAAARADVLAAQLRVRLGALALAADVDIRAVTLEETTSPFGSPALRLGFEWSSLRSPGLFPAMHAALSVYALSPYETQLDFVGHYDPPLGLLGDAIDTLIGRRIAEACVLHFVQDVAGQLRHELGLEARCE